MRTIDADYLKAGFEEDGHLTPYIEGFINSCPTVETVRHGEWRHRYIPQMHVSVTGKICCSECSGSFWSITGKRFDFCPKCGANMGGKTDAKQTVFTE